MLPVACASRRFLLDTVLYVAPLAANLQHVENSVTLATVILMACRTAVCT